MSIGVGIIGAGPGAGALHIPTSARLGEQFRVVHVSDSGSGRAVALAARSGARSSTGVAELLADPAVEAVVIASPPDQHAAQVRAAVAAGARGILCEKPLALTHEDVDAVIAECRAAGTVLVVGTNHLYDPAWLRAKHHLIARGESIRQVSVTVSLPPNDRYHAVVTEAAAASGAAPRGGPDVADPRIAAAIVHRLIIGLAVHDLPLLRDLAPRLDRVVYARPVAPIGFVLGYRAGEALVQVSCVMAPEGAEALWRLAIGTEGDRIEIAFPPAFVHSGGAAVTVRHAEGRVTEYPRDADDGYVELWHAFSVLLDGAEAVEYDELAADAHFAVELADAAAAVIGGAATTIRSGS